VVAALRAFALVDNETIVDERDVGIVTRAIRLHRLVREVAAALPTIKQRETAKTALISAIAELYPEDVFHDPKTWPRARRLDALALALVDDKDELSDIVDKSTEIPKGAEQQAALLMCRLGAYRQGALGAYAKARSLHNRALALRENGLGSEHPDTAESLNYLAILLREQDDRITARPLFERALKIRKKIHGLDHRDTAESLNNLALLLWDEGNLKNAQSLFGRALKIRERVLGFEHEDTGSSYNNLALVLRDQGNLIEARPLFERALEIKLNTLGFEHPYTAVSFNNLALALRDLHDYGGAQPLFESALTIWEKVSGPEHPYTGRTRANFARMLFMAGNAEAAQSEGYAAIAVHEKAQGPTHHWTLDAAQVTIDALVALGRLDEAVGLQERYPPTP
jgi:tetratricopeptide (TPR) repeat protein